jgi:hypothetical protein
MIKLRVPLKANSHWRFVPYIDYEEAKLRERGHHSSVSAVSGHSQL